ncbi:hypothetical protein GALMADRAFT_218917 [Galerina marginata CBS 339.88]|uniref:Uncharacterized protein n=1 Tax=Galerina marginata (strain CBS 339.88) TaxID=685588 RepID=A0A067TRM8_GALM3|nr:hypothetical protein GALMADRAFT_218917 [Galerina marginata CBS 339.88]
MADQEVKVEGASNNERLLGAARDDNEDLLLKVFEDEGSFDINCYDGLGNTRVVMHGSTDVLEHILSHEDCDVDPINRTTKSTPLHLAVQIQHTELRLHIFDSLLEAGADTSIKDKNGETVLDLLPEDDTKLRALVRKHQAQASVSRDDVASGDEGDSGSGSDDD